MKLIDLRRIIISIVFLSMPLLGRSQDKLKILVIFAHTSEGVLYAGGTSTLFTQLGHEVKFMTLTQGGLERKYKEAQQAKEILDISDYELLNNDASKLKNTEKVRQEVAKKIRDWDADIVFTYYPAKSNQRSNNTTVGWIVREASSLLTKEQMPVFLYMRDYYTSSLSYIPDFAIDISTVWETKLAALRAHESEVFELHPKLEGVYDEVSSSKEKKENFLFHNIIPYSMIRPDNMLALEKWYGKEAAQDVKYVEEFEIAEYGRQPTNAEVSELFPIIGSKVITMPGKSRWFDTGIDVREGQTYAIEANGKIIWNNGQIIWGQQKVYYCDADGSVPYTRRGTRPLMGQKVGALIGKIGEDSTKYFFVGKNNEIHTFKSGRLFLGINDDNTNDNEGFFRVRIQTKK